MILIADSGSTKTEWSGGLLTQGINPFHQDDATIRRIINNELKPQLSATVDAVYFYGSGCTVEASPRLQTILEDELHCRAEVGSDMLGAARALLGHDAGIACILGTGANSCYYDGKTILMNTPPLGFILGDEGSAAYIGRRLVGDVFKHQLSPAVCQMFTDETHLTSADVVNRVYRQPMANRFLGEVSQFCQHHLDNAEIYSLVADCFRQFFIRNIHPYLCRLNANTAKIDDIQIPCSFVGSVAWAYAHVIRDVAHELGYSVDTIVRRPMDGMQKYHGL